MAKKQKKQMSDINVVPYIDVMLVLLIIFMVTAPMLTQGVKVELPQVTSDPMEVQDQQPPIIVSVDSNGAYYMEIGGEPGNPTDLATLRINVSKILQQTPKIKVLVRGDRHAEYGEVVRLMAAMQESGVESLGLITENPQG